MPNNRRRLQGRVVSNKMEKTVTVLVEQRKMHRIYKKVVNTSRKILAHDESNAIPMGAVVRVVESKPLSKRKRWVVEQVLETPDIVAAAGAVSDPTPAPEAEPETPAETGEEA